MQHPVSVFNIGRPVQTRFVLACFRRCRTAPGSGIRLTLATDASVFCRTGADGDSKQAICRETGDKTLSQHVARRRRTEAARLHQTEAAAARPGRRSIPAGAGSAALAVTAKTVPPPRPGGLAVPSAIVTPRAPRHAALSHRYTGRLI